MPDSTKLRPSTTGTAYGDNVTNSINTLMEKTSYTYDGFNRMKKAETIKDGKRTTAEYTYNGDGLRVSKTVKKSDNNYAAETTNYLYDRQNVILETDGGSNVKARYIKGVNYIAKADAKNSVTYFLYNGHGDVVQTTDEAGTIQNQYDYDIWGNPTLTVETAENSIRYAGEYLDSETGLYYLRARYYDSYTGRFTSEDSYWGEDENPLSLNLYTYCENDPIRYTDPSGHKKVKAYDKKNNNVNDVKYVQSLLVKLGYDIGDSGKYHDGIDGDFKNDTLYAVNQFKKTYNLSNTGANKGVVGDTTLAYLEYAVSVKEAQALISNGKKSGNYSDISKGYTDKQEAKKTLNDTMQSLRSENNKLNTTGPAKPQTPASHDKDTSKPSDKTTTGNDKKPSWERNSGTYWRDDGMLQTPEGIIPTGSKWAINNGYYWRKDGLYQTPDGVVFPPNNFKLPKKATKQFNEALKIIEQEAKNEEKLNLIQSGLDVAGMIPVVGEPIDGVNAAIYWARGDKVNAALSAASMIPVTGWVTEGGKLVKKTIKVVAKYGDDAFEGIKVAGKEIDKVVEEVAKTQIVVNREVGNMFDVYVEGTKLKGAAKQGLLQTQEIFTVDRASRVVKPDYSIYDKTGELCAIGDAKSGAISMDEQFRGFVEIAAKSKSKTIIYYTPLGNTLSSMPAAARKAIKEYADQNEVKIIEIGVK